MWVVLRGRWHSFRHWWWWKGHHRRAAQPAAAANLTADLIHAALEGGVVEGVRIVELVVHTSAEQDAEPGHIKDARGQG